MDNKINISTLRIEQLNQSLYQVAHEFLENVFTKEQNIPKELIPLENENQKWWCIRNANEILGVVAAWKVESEWHMGRLATDEKLRGLGLGTKLIIKAIDDLFQTETELIIIEARDIAVKIILKLGGKVTGESDYFFDMPITPMVVLKEDFNRVMKNKL